MCSVWETYRACNWPQFFPYFSSIPQRKGPIIPLHYTTPIPSTWFLIHNYQSNSHSALQTINLLIEKRKNLQFPWQWSLNHYGLTLSLFPLQFSPVKRSIKRNNYCNGLFMDLLACLALKTIKTCAWPRTVLSTCLGLLCFRANIEGNAMQHCLKRNFILRFPKTPRPIREVCVCVSVSCVDGRRQ
jgi:hypothetical protein